MQLDRQNIRTFITDNNDHGTQNIIRWSNPDSKTATTVNSTIIAAALVDASGDFRIYAGVIYDDTDNRQIGIACDLAVYYMRKRFADGGNFAALRENAIVALKDLRKVTHSDTIVAEKKLANVMPETTTDKSFFDSSAMYNKGFIPLSPSTVDTFYSLDYP